jgi:hydroxylaminobenzene mutase
MLEGASFVLCFVGPALYLGALLNGLAIPKMTSPRLGFSAHLTGLQSGTFLIAVGLLWDRISISRSWSASLAYGLAVTLVLIWFASLLAAAFGTGEGLPIAGQGVTTTSARQRAVNILIATGSLGLIVAVAGVLGAMVVAD